MMKKTSRIAAAAFALASLASFGANAADYEFDTVTQMHLGSNSSIDGIARNSSTPLRLVFRGNAGGIDDATRCTPFFLTMLEKPGRYYLTITTTTVSGSSAEYLTHCGLRLR